MSSRFHNIDLTLDLKPPKELYVEVRVNRDYGKISLAESGEVNLQKDRVIFLRRADAEQLLKKGMVSEL